VAPIIIEQLPRQVLAIGVRKTNSARKRSTVRYDFMEIVSERIIDIIINEAKL
jgi:hypothetical protein